MHFANGTTRPREIKLGDDVWDSIIPAGGPRRLKTSRVDWIAEP